MRHGISLPATSTIWGVDSVSAYVLRFTKPTDPIAVQRDVISVIVSAIENPVKALSRTDTNRNHRKCVYN
jgi:hypothetical protein